MESVESYLETQTSLSTPVVLIMFNRPELTKLTLAAIRRVRPEKLFVVSDGARATHPEEKNLVEACRDLISAIDWPCEITRIYSNSNMGCRDRIASGLSHVFELVDRAIILEDDCLPNDSFFFFTQELLGRYANDSRVGLIGGTRLLDFRTDDPTSYFFSKHPQIWGWATWSRVWREYNVRMSDWPEMRKTTFLAENLETKKAIANWRQNFNLVFWRKIDTWDYQFVYTLWKNKMLSIVPTSNLVSNLGFGESATHTLDSTSPFSALPAGAISWPLTHPKSVSVNKNADHLSEMTLFQSSGLRRLQLVVYHFSPSVVKKFVASLRNFVKSHTAA